MIINNLNIPIFVRKNPNHAAIKTNLLAAIISMGKHSICDRSQCISNTDWFLPPNISRPYWDIFLQSALDHIEEIGNHQHFINGRIVNYWFQQYKQNDFHGWHIHPSCMFSNIYFVELPNDTQTTFNIMGNEVSFAVAEGDILTFPNSLIHCSKPNKSIITKTSIVFNSDYLDVTDSLKYSYAPKSGSCCH